MIQRSFIASLVAVSGSATASSSADPHRNRPSTSTDDDNDNQKFSSAPAAFSAATAAMRRRLYTKPNSAAGLFYPMAAKSTSDETTSEGVSSPNTHTSPTYALRQAISMCEEGVTTRGGGGVRLEVVDRRRGISNDQLVAPSVLMRKGHHQHNNHQANGELSTNQVSLSIIQDVYLLWIYLITWSCT